MKPKYHEANFYQEAYQKNNTMKFVIERKYTMKPPVSVCHQVSDIGHLDSPTTLKNHLQEINIHFILHTSL